MVDSNGRKGYQNDPRCEIDSDIMKKDYVAGLVGEPVEHVSLLEQIISNHVTRLVFRFLCSDLVDPLTCRK